MKVNNSIWITWERHRRSFELSEAFGSKLYVLLESSSDIPYRIIRYFYLSLKTLFIILKEKPGIVFVQNPSMILAVISSLLKPFFGYKLIIDRHTTFLLNKPKHNLRDKTFLFLSDFSLRKADLTIVTNRFLKDYVENRGAKGVVLPDRLPEFPQHNEADITLNHIVTFICSYSPDEPYSEVIKSASLINPSIILYITGNYNKINSRILESAPTNVRFTGFIPNNKYKELLQKSDIIIVLTSADYTMLCGAYEAVATNKPLITSDTEVLVEYFNKGTIYTKNSAGAISESIKKAYENYEQLSYEIILLKEEIKREWEINFNKIDGLVKSCHSRESGNP